MLGTYTKQMHKKVDKKAEINIMLSVNVASEMNESTTYNESLRSKSKEHLLKAMKCEIKSLEGNKTWSLVDLPKGRKSCME